ncbi:MAG: septum formation protein Maf [Alphaproteobacteria bacterium]|nr:septum formation protein Maf [Alphaproteobacteria bacterium]
MASPKLILASGSAARQSMLKNAGLSFEVKPADLDEELIIHTAWKNKETVQDITEMLAKAKAKAVSKNHSDALVIGSDQTLEFDGQILSKAKNKEEAFEKLKSLSGKTHRLISSVAVAQNAEILFSTTDMATLTMHSLTDEQLQNYGASDPDALTSCVGAYKIEGAGAALFSDIDGDRFTIMGMPLASLLEFLKERGVAP